MTMRALEIDAEFAQHLQWMGIAMAPAGRRLVHPDTGFETPVTLGDLDYHAAAAQVGAFSYFAPGGRLGNAEVGRYCSIGPGVQIGMTRHPIEGITTSPIGYVPDFLNFERHFALAGDGWERRLPLVDYDIQPRTRIGNDVWIGASAYLKDGITVGDGAVIGAHAVVTRNVPPYAIVAGNPARVIRMRFPEPMVARLQALAWWRFNLLDVAIDCSDLATALPQLEAGVADGSLEPYEPGAVGLIEEHGRFRKLRRMMLRRAA